MHDENVSDMPNKSQNHEGNNR